MHKFGDYHYLELHGRIKRSLQRPLRERLLVRKALSELGIVYREMVVFRNEFYKGWKGAQERAPQWLDFCLSYKRKMYVLLFHPGRKTGGAKRREKEAHEAKKKFLMKKGIKYLVLKRNETSQIYAHRIQTFLGKESQQ